MAQLNAQDLGRLFQAIQWPSQKTNIVHKGSVVNFHYVGQRRRPIHDPYPLVLVSDIFSDAIRGVNLNYLTVPYVKSLIQTYLDQPFSYANIKNDPYIAGDKGREGAFRTYKRAGISQLRMMDASFLRGVAAVSRSLNPNELDQIRLQIEQLIREQMRQPVAQPGEISEPLV